MHVECVGIYFTAVDKVLEQCPLKIMGNVLTIERYLPQKSTDETDSSDDEVEFDGSQTSILVSGLPGNVDKDYLEMFFEHRRFGSGTVTNMELFLDQSFAIVTFSEPECKY